MQSCDQATVGEVLPAAWREPPTDSTLLSWLVSASIATRDGRILESVLASTGPQHSRIVRYSGLRVLVSYADQRVWVDLEDLSRRAAIILPFTDHSLGRPGSVPLPRDTRDRVLARLHELAHGDSDDEVRKTADFLLRAFPQP
jgi:hypothetical protein